MIHFVLSFFLSIFTSAINSHRRMPACVIPFHIRFFCNLCSTSTHSFTELYRFYSPLVAITYLPIEKEWKSSWMRAHLHICGNTRETHSPLSQPMATVAGKNCLLAGTSLGKDIGVSPERHREWKCEICSSKLPQFAVQLMDLMPGETGVLWLDDQWVVNSGILQTLFRTRTSVSPSKRRNRGQMF